MTLTWEDVRVWCEELSAWITELGEEEEFKVAEPGRTFPLTPDEEKDDLQDDIDVIGYLTLWMTCKSGKLPPTGLHNRMMLCDKFKGPWQKLYSRAVRKIENKPTDIQGIFDLAE
jgi:hypothetical protein